MTTFVALLRGVNLAGHKKVAMSDLRALAVGLGLIEPRTLLQSGNLVFRNGGRTSPATLETKLSEGLRLEFGLETDVFVRSADEWRAMAAANPFHREASRDPGHLLVMCLRQAPKAGALSALRAAIVGRERVETVERQAYFVYPDGVGRSRLTHAIIERHFGRGTARNWNTVGKLAEAAR